MRKPPHHLTAAALYHFTIDPTTQCVGSTVGPSTEHVPRTLRVLTGLQKPSFKMSVHYCASVCCTISQCT